MKLIVAVLLFAHNADPTPYTPQGWTYPMECCGGSDCSRFPQANVLTTPRGFLIKPFSITVPYNDKRIRKSPDEFYHACINDEFMLTCFFVPAMQG